MERDKTYMGRATAHGRRPAGRRKRARRSTYWTHSWAGVAQENDEAANARKVELIYQLTRPPSWVPTKTEECIQSISSPPAPILSPYSPFAGTWLMWPWSWRSGVRRVWAGRNESCRGELVQLHPLPRARERRTPLLFWLMPGGRCRPFGGERRYPQTLPGSAVMTSTSKCSSWPPWTPRPTSAKNADRTYVPTASLI